MSISTSNVSINFDTFTSLVGQLDIVLNALGTIIVTTAANTIGDSTTGNASIIGIFNANTIAVGNNLTGGSITTPSTLNISSNLTSNGSLALFNSNVTIQAANLIANVGLVNIMGGNLTIYSNTLISNTVLISGNTTHTGTLTSNANVSFGNGQFNSTSNTYLNAANVTINGLALNLNSNTNHTANVTFVGLNINISSIVNLTNVLTTTGNTTLSNTVFNGTVLPGTANTLGSSGNRWNTFQLTSDITTITSNTIAANSVSSNNFSINGIATFVTIANTNVGANISSPQTLITFPTATYRSGSLNIQSLSPAGDSQLETILFVQNSSNVYYTTSGIIFSNTQLYTTTATINGANVNINITQNVANLSVKILAQLIGT